MEIEYKITKNYDGKESESWKLSRLRRLMDCIDDLRIQDTMIRRHRMPDIRLEYRDHNELIVWWKSSRGLTTDRMKHIDVVWSEITSDDGNPWSGGSVMHSLGWRGYKNVEKRWSDRDYFKNKVDEAK